MITVLGALLLAVAATPGSVLAHGTTALGPATPAQAAGRGGTSPAHIKARADAFRRTHYGLRPVAADAMIKAHQQAQSLATTSTVGGDWTPLGPEPINAGGSVGLVSGRISAMAVNPHNSQDVWAGAANGGVWHSTNGGQTWMPMSDFEDSLATGSIAIDPTDPSGNTVYVGTGEANASDSYWGLGVLKTTDGGTSWLIDNNGKPFGYNEFAGLSVSKLIVDPVNSQVVLAAVCCGNPGVTSGINTASNTGIWRSTDGDRWWANLDAGTRWRSVSISGSE